MSNPLRFEKVLATLKIVFWPPWRLAKRSKKELLGKDFI